MLVRMRRWASLVAVVLVGLGLVVFDPNGPDAMASTTVPDPLTYSGSVLSSGNTLDSSTWNKVLTNTDGMVGNVTTSGSSASSLGSKASLMASSGTSAAGMAAAAIVGLSFGLEFGSQIAYAFGISDTGDWSCDLREAITGSAGTTCAVEASDNYVINSDLQDQPDPGWAGASQYSDLFGALATAYVSDTGLSYGASSGTFTASLVYTGFSQLTYGTSYAQGVAYSLVLYCKDASGVLTSVSGAGLGLSSSLTYTTSGTLGNSYSGQKASYSWSCASGSTLEGVKFVSASSQYVKGGTSNYTENVSWWYPQGDARRPAEVSSNPQRWWRTTWECSEGAGGVSLSDGFYETDTEWPGFPVAECDAGAVTRVLIEQITEGLTDTTVIYDWTADPAYVEWAQSDCVSGGCQLLLSRIDSVTGTRVSCFANPSLCTDWFTDADKESSYECTYGGEVVELSECNAYAPTFNLSLTSQGINYADPETGEYTDTGTSTGGDTGADEDDSCPPPFSWSSLVNPWWYYKGTVCALEEAFVPDTATLTEEVDTTRDQLETTAPFSVVSLVEPTITGLADGWTGGCDGDLAAFDPWGLGRMSIPCDPPDGMGFGVMYTVLLIVVVSTTAFACWHMVVAALGGHSGEDSAG
ncbi:MAG TPA: hypothetical protein VGC67_01910 [Cellulomonas sp.]